MIEIIRTNHKEMKKFSKKEWDTLNVQIYGSGANWKEYKFAFKAEEDGNIVGVLELRVQAGIGKIDDIIVAEGKRGKGIGKALIKEAENTAKKLGAHKIYLITGKKWKTVDFYESLGYKKTGTLPRHFLKEDFVQFSKFI
jgi:N-acetylglutamate synthase-like GNAT family acetyltransferase